MENEEQQQNDAQSTEQPAELQQSEVAALESENTTASGDDKGDVETITEADVGNVLTELGNSLASEEQGTSGAGAEGSNDASTDFPAEDPDTSAVADAEEIAPTDTRDTVVVGGDEKYYTPQGAEITSQLIDDVLVYMGGDPEDFDRRIETRNWLQENPVPSDLYDEEGKVVEKYVENRQLDSDADTSVTTPSGEVITEEMVKQVIAHNGYTVAESEEVNLRNYVITGLMHLGMPAALLDKPTADPDAPVVKVDHSAAPHLDAISAEINQYGGALADRINASVTAIRKTLA